MRIEDSKYSTLYDKKVSVNSGDFFFFKKFVVGEIGEGVHFNWELAKEVVQMANDHYGKVIKVAYISNRVNSYSVHAQDWQKFYKEKNQMEAMAVVAYNKIGIMNVVLENIFIQSNVKKFNVLDDAINWVLALKIDTSIQN